MTLIYKDAVNSQLLKGHHIVLAALVIQLRQPVFQGFPGTFHLLDGIILRMVPLGFPDTVQDAVNLPPQNDFLPLTGHGNLLKLRVSDDDSVIIAGGNPGTELLSVLGFKVLFGGNQNVCGGVKLEPLRRPLLCDVVGHHNQGLGTQSQPLALHCRRNNFEGLPCPNFVGKQCISAVHDVGDGVDLMLAKGDFRVHAGKADVLTVILPGTDGIEGFVVDTAQPLPAINVLPNPFREFCLDQLLPILGNGSLLLVQHPDFVAVGIELGVINADILLIQGLLKDVIGIDALGAVGGNRLDVAAVKGFVGHIPFAGMGRIQHMDFVSCVGTGADDLIQELLVDFFRHPVDTNADANLTGSQIHRLHSSQSFDVTGEQLFLFGW